MEGYNLPLIYKPIRQFMYPNESTIDPKVDNEFTSVIGGQTCIAYRFLVYDLQDNLIKTASVETKTPTKIYYRIVNVDFGRDRLMIDTNDLTNGQAFQFVTDGKLPEPLVTNKTYYIGNIDLGIFNVFTSKDDALNNKNMINIMTSGDGNHGIQITAPLYNGDTLIIPLEKNKLTAGNTYKWQVELFANDLAVKSVDITNNTLQITNHNLVTGDTVFVSAGTLPNPLKEYTTYYVRKIDNNTIALYSNIEAARNDAARIDITTAGTNVIVSNIAISEQIIFLVYDPPIVEFKSTTITRQSHKFKPIYTHPQGIMIENYTVFIRSENNPDLITTSGLQENIKLEYTFDGLLAGTVYDVKFVINTKARQTYETRWTPFKVEYDAPEFGMIPDAVNDEYHSCIVVSWPKAVQITGEPSGDLEFVNNFIYEGNVGLRMKPNTKVEFNDLEIRKGSMPPMFWWSPNCPEFTGTIMRCENTNTGGYIEIGYNGVSFYRIINGIKFNNAPLPISNKTLYMIGMTKEELIVNVIGNR